MKTIILRNKISIYPRVWGWLIMLILFSFCQIAAAQTDDGLPPAPNPPRLVNDFTGSVLSPDQASALEHKLVAYDDSTSNQIAVVIVDQLGGRSIDDYAIALGRKWGVGGQKQFSNGVVILVNTATKGDKRGVFIATGYGLEGAVTDLIAGEIIQNNLIPNFKTGNYFQGLDEATDNIIKAAAGRYKAPDAYHRKGKGLGTLSIILIMIIVFVIISFTNRNGGGGYVSRRGYSDNWGRGGVPWIFPGGFGGGSGGGGFGGGGGGFGGFGGGGFGGGGAGGSW